MSVNKGISQILCRIIIPLIFLFRPIPVIAPSGHCAQVTYTYLLNQLQPIRSIGYHPQKRESIAVSVAAVHPPVFVLDGGVAESAFLVEVKTIHFFFLLVLLAVLNNRGFDCEELFN
ncbi:hypothetical protein CEXT_344301 [Caerostris extrusa]|uniref:Uncharacterized protein n=1 Tax=Caerostris extrusa TaxID=172846 RepID=A0AAV4TYI4_CAEEX|nr:hypothetical protein CEXT_344301 [Caerostris extrusa]